MKIQNVDKMISYITNPQNTQEVIRELEFSYEDAEELIEYIGRKLSFLKAVRGVYSHKAVI